MPVIVYAVPPVGSVSVLIKYGPADQSIIVKSPEITLPVPISAVTRPEAFVVVVIVST